MAWLTDKEVRKRKGREKGFEIPAYARTGLKVQI
jgi:hypothetical protein